MNAFLRCSNSRLLNEVSFPSFGTCNHYSVLFTHEEHTQSAMKIKVKTCLSVRI